VAIKLLCLLHNAADLHFLRRDRDGFVKCSKIGGRMVTMGALTMLTSVGVVAYNSNESFWVSRVASLCRLIRKVNKDNLTSHGVTFVVTMRFRLFANFIMNPRTNLCSRKKKRFD
jgi:hypothetical protein